MHRLVSQNSSLILNIREMESSFLSLPVLKELKYYLQDTGRIAGNTKRSELVIKCKAATTLYLEKDSNGLMEDGQKAI